MRNRWGGEPNAGSAPSNLATKFAPHSFAPLALLAVRGPGRPEWASVHEDWNRGFPGLRDRRCGVRAGGRTPLDARWVPASDHRRAADSLERGAGVDRATESATPRGSGRRDDAPGAPADPRESAAVRKENGHHAGRAALRLDGLHGLARFSERRAHTEGEAGGRGPGAGPHSGTGRGVQGFCDRREIRRRGGPVDPAGASTARRFPEALPQDTEASSRPPLELRGAIRLRPRAALLPRSAPRARSRIHPRARKRESTGGFLAFASRLSPSVLQGTDRRGETALFRRVGEGCEGWRERRFPTVDRRNRTERGGHRPLPAHGAEGMAEGGGPGESPP